MRIETITEAIEELSQDAWGDVTIAEWLEAHGVDADEFAPLVGAVSRGLTVQHANTGRPLSMSLGIAWTAGFQAGLIAARREQVDS